VLAVCAPGLALQRIGRGLDVAGRDLPLAVAAEGRVVASNAAARAAGVDPGGSLVQARAACAGLRVHPDDPAADRAALEGLAEALLALSPAIELAGPEVLLLDASAAHLVAGGAPDPEAALASRALSLAGEMGYRCRAAVATGRGPARALARFGGAAAPVPPERTAAALASLPLQALGLPEPIAARLRSLGIADAGALARLPAEAIGDRFGAEGVDAWRLARGDDPTPLAPWAPGALPAEAVDLDAPVDAAEPLLFAAKRLCDRAAARLAGRGLGASRLTLALALDDGGAERLAIGLAAPSAAASRWLLVVRERLAALRLPAAVRAVRLEVDAAAPAPPEQLALGDRPEQLAALDVVLARLTARLGEGNVFAAEPVERHRPEVAVRRRSFRRERARGERRGDLAAGEEAPPRPTRLLPAPLPAVAEGEGGRVTALRVDGRAHRVLSMSPPERLAGEWWDEPFDRDYRRVRLADLGDCWVFRDRGSGRLWLHGFFD
jgi:protein ImuB